MEREKKVDRKKIVMPTAHDDRGCGNRVSYMQALLEHSSGVSTQLGRECGFGTRRRPRLRSGMNAVAKRDRDMPG